MSNPNSIGIIESAPGQKSSTRVMSLLLAFTGCAVYGWSAYSGQPAPEIPPSWLPLAAAILGAPSLNTLAEGKVRKWAATIAGAR